MIQIVGPQLHQWDTGRSISVSGSNATHAHIANRGDSHAPIMELVDGKAKIPDYLLQTGKDLCVYLVLDGITQESNIFSVRKRERPENYVYEEDRRNYIYELIDGALSATEAADQAAKNADEAAEKASKAADLFTFIGDASGSNIHLDKALDQPFLGMRIFGKTTQNGTPTPDAPVELVSVGASGSIAVDVTGDYDGKRMVVTTTKGLPGIPTDSGGNYINAAGKHWVCDEIDLARGVYVRRIGSVTLNGTQSFGINAYQLNALKRYLFEFYPTNLSQEAIDMPAISDKLIYAKWDTFTAKETRATVYATSERLIIFLPDQTIRTVDAFKTYLASNPIKIMYQLKTPTETPLSSEELAAYAALRTYRKSTTVSNDAGAHMEVEYLMDAKKYLDSQISSGILAATVE